ncbi:hemerythrin domain-containing protein [Kribbella capetownensis]|uniref:hemerythrin domain-containing protein n=1 Tax=Kribbella capetownensis TaxID=1572659 RepID=UPI001EDCBCB2|nr:hemerythrin domain-containing protein [Kribbella capetownensis]
MIDVLTADHREVQELANQISATASTDERRELTDQLIAELVRHSVAEEMYVYPAMRDHLPDGEKAVEHDTEEHKELETLMKQLEGADAATTAFEDTLRNLQEVLVDHVQDEETEQFPQLRTSIPAAKLIELKEKVETAKRLAPTRPHPAAPNAELFHKLVGPGVGLVDRLRDKLTGRNS